jgi:hypothetical protein
MDLGDVYNPPPAYDNIDKIRMSFIKPKNVFLEANKKFILLNNKKNYWYYDTVPILLPESTHEIINKIFFKFEEKLYPDSIFLVVTESDQHEIFWKQIFYSSIQVSDLNVKSDDSENFRINKTKLVSNDLIKDNDTLIELSFEEYNNNIKPSIDSNCGTKCSLYKSICDKISLPCRILSLMGGDAYYAGYYDDIGYPLHALCEIYSSKFKKWYVVDPTYGIMFKKNDTPLNAVEISNKVYFNTEKEIVKDSIFFTKRSLLGKDYYKFYDNIFFNTNLRFNSIIEKLLHAFFRDLDFQEYHFANSMLFSKDGHYYFGLKCLMYLLLSIIYFHIMFLLIGLRLLKVKKPSSEQILNK